MKTFKSNEAIEVLGVSFDGVEDIIRHALDKEPKAGVYVGEDSKRYPIFDEHDFMYENRYYWNFVFARSQKELDAKMTILKGLDWKFNYGKMADELHPMIYWGGDSHCDVYMTEEASECLDE